MKKKVFLISLIGLFLMCGIALATGEEVQPGKAALEKNIQAGEMEASSAPDKNIAAPEGFSEPEKEEALPSSSDVDEKVAPEKDAAPPTSPEKTTLGE